MATINTEHDQIDFMMIAMMVGLTGAMKFAGIDSIFTYLTM